MTSGVSTLPVGLKTTPFVIIFAFLVFVTQVVTRKVYTQCKSSGQIKTGKSETQYFLKVTNKPHILSLFLGLQEMFQHLLYAKCHFSICLFFRDLYFITY